MIPKALCAVQLYRLPQICPQYPVELHLLGLGQMAVEAIPFLAEYRPVDALFTLVIFYSHPRSLFGTFGPNLS